MSMDLTRGQRLKLDALGLSDGAFSVAVELNAGPLTVDVACFGLDGARKLSDERYMTFFNQPATPCGAVKLGQQGRFDFDLPRLPSSIQVLVMTLAVDGTGTMNQLGSSSVSLRRGSTLSGSYRFDGGHFSAERAVMLLEFYRKDGAWRLCPVGQGFNGGLDALVTHFGGAVAEKPSAPPAAPRPAPAPPPPPAPPKVSLSKVTLEKRGEKISLEKRGQAGHGRIVCNLNWSSGQSQEKRGLLGGMFGKTKSSGIDLDLGCLFELSDGYKGVVQALGNAFGDFNQEPYIHMAGDDRTGANASGEFLYINGDHLKDLHRICIFAFIYEGVANWGQADAVVTLTVPGHPPVEVRLDNHDNTKNMCAIAMIENDGGRLKITKLGEYFSGHLELDHRYGWGLHWRKGSKD